MGLWYRRQYNLPVNHPLFLSLSEQDLWIEYWAYHYDDLHRAGKLVDEVETDDWDNEVEKFLAGTQDADWEDVGDNE